MDYIPKNVYKSIKKKIFTGGCRYYHHYTVTVAPLENERHAISNYTTGANLEIFLYYIVYSYLYFTLPPTTVCFLADLYQLAHLQVQLFRA